MVQSSFNIQTPAPWDHWFMGVPWSMAGWCHNRMLLNLENNDHLLYLELLRVERGVFSIGAPFHVLFHKCPSYCLLIKVLGVIIYAPMFGQTHRICTCIGWLCGELYDFCLHGLGLPPKKWLHVYIHMVNLWLSATKNLVLLGWLFSMCNKKLKDQTIQGRGCLSNIYPLVN